MSGRPAVHTDRHRPRYPPALIETLVAGGRPKIYADYLGTIASPSTETESEVTVMIEQCGFTADRKHFVENLHYGVDEWLDLVFTYSNHLALESSSPSNHSRAPSCAHGCGRGSARPGFMPTTTHWRSSVPP